jgi:hypothetical protein
VKALFIAVDFSQWLEEQTTGLQPKSSSDNLAKAVYFSIIIPSTKVTVAQQ